MSHAYANYHYKRHLSRPKLQETSFTTKTAGTTPETSPQATLTSPDAAMLTTSG